jgi:hypothetical protein
MKILIALILILVSRIGYAQQNHTFHFVDSAYSKIIVDKDTSDGEVFSVVTRVTQSYHVQCFRNDDNNESSPVLISEQNSQKVSSGLEGEQGLIVLTARISDKGNFDKIIWWDSLNANAINYSDDYFEIESMGCCGALDGKEIFRYEDGKPILQLTSDLYTVEIPNTQTKRYVGFLDNGSADGGYSDVTESFLFGVLTYVNPKSLLKQRLVITSKNKELYESSGMEGMEGVFDSLKFAPSEKIDITNLREYSANRELSLWSHDKNPDPAGLSGFFINIYLMGDKNFTIKIPIKNDKIDISALHSNYFNFVLR